MRVMLPCCPVQEMGACERGCQGRGCVRVLLPNQGATAMLLIPSNPVCMACCALCGSVLVVMVLPTHRYLASGSFLVFVFVLVRSSVVDHRQVADHVHPGLPLLRLRPNHARYKRGSDPEIPKPVRQNTASLVKNRGLRCVLHPSIARCWVQTTSRFLNQKVEPSLRSWSGLLAVYGC